MQNVGLPVTVGTASSPSDDVAQRCHVTVMERVARVAPRAGTHRAVVLHAALRVTSAHRLEVHLTSILTFVSVAPSVTGAVVI